MTKKDSLPVILSVSSCHPERQRRIYAKRRGLFSGGACACWIAL